VFPLILALSPAFAEAASRRQAPGERGILEKDEREREIRCRRKNYFVSMSHKELG